jgi:hypothetical protein
MKGVGASFVMRTYSRIARSRSRVLRCAALDLFLREQRKPPLDQIQPGRAGRLKWM